MSDAKSIELRRLTADDIEFGMHLKNIAGWNQLPVDWERFLQWQPEGCFLATCDGEPAGTATTVNYSNRFGWVGMVLVLPEFRRQGIGTTLLMSCVEYLEDCGVSAVKLDATPLGKELYDTIGFVDEYMLERHQAAATPQGEPAGVEPLTDEHMAAVCEHDLATFGADRSRVLTRLHGETQVHSFMVRQGAQVRGYAFVRPGMNAAYIGPWVAEAPDIADDLFRRALTSVGSGKVFVDVSLACPHASAIIARYGFERQRELIRMCRGRNEHPGRTDVVYGVAGVEIG